MASVREAIRMSEDEIADFLSAPHKMQLATINRDGTPHLVTMYYAVFDGLVGFWTYRTSQKAKNLDRDPRATVLVETGEGYDQLHGVQIGGMVERITDEARILACGSAIYGRYVGEITPELEGYVRQQAQRRWAYLLQPQRVASWDHRKLAAAMSAAGS